MNMRLVRILTILLFIPFGARAALLEMKIFGDSLSDTGNMHFLSTGAIPPEPIYYQGRFSNGPIWADQVAAATGAGTVNNVYQSVLLSSGIDNFAVGGSYTGTFPFPDGSHNSNDLRLSPPMAVFPGLQQQVQLYDILTGGGALLNPDAWHVVWAGANDILFAPIVIDATPETMAAVALQAVANIGTAVGDLYGLGAREFLIFNVPDIGATPFGVAPIGGGPETLGPLLSFGSGVFNTGMNILIDLLPELYPEIDVTLLDVDSLFSQLLADVLVDPAVMAMFPDASEMSFVPPGLSFCFDQDGLYASHGGPYFCFGSDPNDRITYDLVHPSSRTHGIIAAAVVRATVPEPAALTLMAIGLLVVWRARSGVKT